MIAPAPSTSVPAIGAGRVDEHADDSLNQPPDAPLPPWQQPARVTRCKQPRDLFRDTRRLRVRRWDQVRFRGLPAQNWPAASGQIQSTNSFKGGCPETLDEVLRRDIGGGNTWPVVPIGV